MSKELSEASADYNKAAAVLADPSAAISQAASDAINSAAKKVISEISNISKEANKV